ncbi:kinase [Streptomyces violarus]|uniref:N-acetylglucosamine kinase-like BadF-type ATPase n=1 Tax=Streptomyces violarus TaxID=67380 RepID=A0A7W5F230_9ACTN|nr:MULTISPECIES: BadF/BadG/BcrA/BcrD ATPase family protein [Streptomyces]MBB3077192.1 N-acetylglucosamine kinase-like BadF-type ATPase [Streptomyces violarus]WRU01171.1 BadF/BadG/BcrA/BcrD ATPase family protein [Streptomyces sp. CGMCC 4.1772]GHD17458.1 kinase [Streptomyces violarus]
MGLTAPVLAIDAGNSKTDVAIVTADGEVLATARGAGFRPPAVGLDTAMNTLADTVTQALTTAGLTSVTHVSACLANADFPVEEDQLATALQARAWGTTVTVRNDTFAILRAGVTEPRGVAVVCGAGINCVGMRPDGRTARFPALGRVSGDWGGGWGLSEEAMWHASRAEDGRGPATALSRTLPAHFGLPSMYALIEALHLGQVAQSRRHELTPVLFTTAADGDTIARMIVDRQAEEVVSMAVVALTRLDLVDEPTPVLLGGGVMAAEHPQLNTMIQNLLADQAPKAIPQVVTASPVLGAALLGLDRVGAREGAQGRLRAHFGV